ncbi:oligosaccharide flippase family protein [Derxia lacustris]|uniref:oligosaccharide flippase family protein n=1 Tax=Derxia lacustris TaxID=764842 RepID=UPI000A1737E4|nr:oligosaccharide flippase family protein [Derxia lacustris]
MAATSSDRPSVAALWGLFESVGVSGLAFVVLVFISHRLAPAEFGLFSMALGIVMLLNIPVECLFHDAILQARKVQREQIDAAFSLATALAFALVALCWLGAPLLGRLLGQPGLGWLLPVLSLSLLPTPLGATLAAVQRRNLEFRSLALRSVASRMGASLVALVMVLSGAGLWSLIAQQLLMAVLGTAVLAYLAPERPRWRSDWSPIRPWLVFGAASTGLAFTAVAASRVFLIAVGAGLGSATAGLFDLAFRIVDTLRGLVSGPIWHLSTTLFSRARHETGSIAGVYATATRMCCALTFPVFAGIACTAPEVVELLFGARWAEAAPLVSLLSATSLLFFARMFGTSVFIALGRPVVQAVISTSAIALIGAGMWLFGRQSAGLASTVWIGAPLLALPVDMFLLWRIGGIGLVDQWRGAATPALAVAAMATVLTLLRMDVGAVWDLPERLGGFAALGAFIYAAVLWLIDPVLFRQLFHRLFGGLIERLRRLGLLAAPGDPAGPPTTL